jgi:hypothetical protein
MTGKPANAKLPELPIWSDFWQAQGHKATSNDFRAFELANAWCSHCITERDAEIARLRKDAERYRYVREYGEEFITADRGVGPIYMYQDQLDAAIDAAMESSHEQIA